MKYSELNERQKKAFKNIKYAAYNLIGGLENTLSDCNEESEDYKYADSLLHSHDSLVYEIYNMALSGFYREGFEGFGDQYKEMVRDIRLCGKESLMRLVEDRVCKEGY